MLDLITQIWRTINDASFYILFGLFVAGLIQSFVDKEKIAKHLGQRTIKSILWAAISGIPLPLCSCSVIPAAVSLKKSGASKGATLSFLISTPESGIDSMALSYALLDPIMTIFRPISAFVTAIIAGIGENIFGKKTQEFMPQETAPCMFCDEQDNNHNHTIIHRFKYGIRYAFVDLLQDISKWLTFGIIIAGTISYLIPQSFIENYLGQGLGAMLVMLFAGIPLYICATASTPIASALIAKGMSPGVAMVFLLAGPATNIATIIAVGKFLGKRSLVIYLVSISVCSIILGLLLNKIYLISGMDIKATLGKAGEIFPPGLKIIFTVGLIILMLNSIFATRRKNEETN